MEFLDNIKKTYLYLFLFLFSVCIYFNTTKNEYAFDDDVIVNGNTSVIKGFKGIKEIFSKDMFASYHEQTEVKGNQLQGGRYRPLSIATFAIEQQFVGFSPGPKHLVNVILYGLLVILIFHFILKDLKLSVFTAFVAAFLFALHPVHTEVVANIKSRDEIMSLIFYLITISSYFKYLEHPVRKNMIWLILAFVAALLSKEYAITLLLVLPVAAYTLKDYSFLKAIKSVSVLMIVFAVYVFIRGKIVGWGAPESTDLLNNPFVLATGVQKFATKIYILLKYLVLLFWPYPLSADYSYAQIPYRSFSDWDVWLSLLVNGALLFVVIRSVLRRKIFGFIGVIYFSNLFLVSNLAFNIGATMGERFLFHSSFAFCLLIAILVERLKEKLSKPTFNKIIYAFLGLVLISALSVIIPRNREWKNTHTLFLKDVVTSPNSALCNANATVALVNQAFDPKNIERKKQLLNEAIVYSKKATELHPQYANAYFNWAVCNFHLANYDTAMVLWEKGFLYLDTEAFRRTFTELVYNRGLKEGGSGNVATGVKLLEWCVKIQPATAKYRSDLGGAYFTVGRLEEAKVSWEKTLALDPANEQANRALPFVKMKIEEQKEGKK